MFTLSERTVCYHLSISRVILDVYTFEYVIRSCLPSRVTKTTKRVCIYIIYLYLWRYQVTRLQESFVAEIFWHHVTCFLWLNMWRAWPDYVYRNIFRLRLGDSHGKGLCSMLAFFARTFLSTLGVHTIGETVEYPVTFLFSSGKTLLLLVTSKLVFFQIKIWILCAVQQRQLFCYRCRPKILELYKLAIRYSMFSWWFSFSY